MSQRGSNGSGNTGRGSSRAKGSNSGFSSKKSYESKGSGSGNGGYANKRPGFGGKPSENRFGSRPQSDTGRGFSKDNDKRSSSSDRKNDFGGEKRTFGGAGKSNFGRNEDRPKRTRIEGTGPQKSRFVHTQNDGFKKRDSSESSFDESEFKPKRFDSGDRPQRSYTDRKPRVEGERSERNNDFKPKNFDSSDRPQRSFSDRKPREDGERSERSSDFKPRNFNSSDRPQRSFSVRKSNEESERAEKRAEFKPRNSEYGDRPQRSFSDRKPRENSERSERTTEFKPRDNDSVDKPRRTFEERVPGAFGYNKMARNERFNKENPHPSTGAENRKKPFDRSKAVPTGKTDRYEKKERKPFTPRSGNGSDSTQAPVYNLNRFDNPRNTHRPRKNPVSDESKGIRLNRYVSNAGVCSRRDADLLIEAGEINVNGVPIAEMGFRVQKGDIVKYGKKTLHPEKLVYVLLNKPKDFITTTDDPENRKTVMDLVSNAAESRLYPIGRLDRNTTGLLLMTNDGELAEKLAHPSNSVGKIYQVELDKPISDIDFEKIQKGIHLEDGVANVDDLAIITPDKCVVGIEIHIGRNRIVRRIFESLGYEVTKLDRVMYASLTKKDLPRGNWRYLTEKEVIGLKFSRK